VIVTADACQWHCQRYEQLLSERQNWDSYWEEIGEFIVPHKKVGRSQRASGTRTGDRVFDSTAIHANGLLAASMQGSLTSDAYPWFTLKMRDQRLNEQPVVTRWLQDCTERMYLALNQSNFAAESMEVYLDLGAFGTAVMLEDERRARDPDLDERFGDVFNGLYFRALTPGEYVIDEDALGFVDTLYRSFEMTARQMVQRWGRVVVPNEVLVASDTTPNQKFDILHCVAPRRNYDPRKLGALHMPWLSLYIAKGAKVPLHESGYDEFPYLCVRWTKSSGEVYGRSPGMTALPDIRSLNRAKELFLRQAAKKIDPPMKQTNDGVVGDIDIRPSGTTVVENMDALQPLDTGGDINWAQFSTAELRQSIQQIFFWEQLQLPGNAGSPTYMTAHEIERRWQTMNRILGPTMGRAKVEWLGKIIDRTFGLMLRRGAFSRIPAELEQSGAEIDVEYEGPLTRAQKSVRVTAFQEWLAAIGPLAETKPEVLDVYDFDKVALDIGRAVSLPASWERDPEQVQQVRQARTQAQEQASQFEQVTEGAAAAGKAAPILRELREAGTGARSAA
jgi:hypothetical protein